jgi:uncharacterized protein
VIFIDSNVPMYLVGAAHRHKLDAGRMLEEAILSGERLVTDAEVLQEILHRYVAIDRRDAIEPALRSMLDVVDEVFPVDVSLVESARDLLLRHPRLSARDAIHVAAMQRHGVQRIMTFDRDYDDMPGIVRVGS